MPSTSLKLRNSFLSETCTLDLLLYSILFIFLNLFYTTRNEIGNVMQLKHSMSVDFSCDRDSVKKGNLAMDSNFFPSMFLGPNFLFFAKSFYDRTAILLYYLKQLYKPP